jgi:hypothetical protein
MEVWITILLKWGQTGPDSMRYVQSSVVKQLSSCLTMCEILFWVTRDCFNFFSKFSTDSESHFF